MTIFPGQALASGKPQIKSHMTPSRFSWVTLDTLLNLSKPVSSLVKEDNDSHPLIRPLQALR